MTLQPKRGGGTGTPGFRGNNISSEAPLRSGIGRQTRPANYQPAPTLTERRGSPTMQRECADNAAIWPRNAAILSPLTGVFRALAPFLRLQRCAFLPSSRSRSRLSLSLWTHLRPQLPPSAREMATSDEHVYCVYCVCVRESARRGLDGLRRGRARF